MNSLLATHFLDYELNELVELYNDKLSSILDKHAPIICRNVINPKREPWHDSGIHSARTALRAYARKWSKRKDAVDKNKFLN